MVTVSNIKEVKKTDGTSFVSLELNGGLELVQSSNTGKWYGTTRRCRIPCTFDINVAKQMIGQTLDGEIVRVESEPYLFISPTTGESLQLQHTYAYRPSGSMNVVGQTKVSELTMA